MNVPIGHLYILAGLLFAIGIVGFLVRRNAIVVFMSIELMLNAVNLVFLGAALTHGGPTGAIAVLFVIVIAAIEAAIGLALIVAFYRLHRSVDLEDANRLKG